MVLNETRNTSTTTSTAIPSKNIMMPRTNMDGPSIPWTVADLFLQPPKLAMMYHVMGISYDLFTPVGALLGAGGGTALGLVSRTVATTTITTPLSSLSFLTMMANGGLVGGGLGMCLGAAALGYKASQGEKLEPLPWNEEGIATRVAGIQHNYKLRTMDASVWTGIVTAGSLYLYLWNSQRNSRLLLTPLQALSLGSTLGALSGIAFIGYTEYQINKALNADDDDDNDYDGK